MKKVIFEIDKEGKVSLRAEGYKEDECMKSPLVQKLLKTLKEEGEIDKETKLYQEQKQVEVNYEELI